MLFIYERLFKLGVFIDHSSNFVPLNISGGLTTTEISNGDEETFWSPSMTVPPQSPSFQSTSHEVRSTPSTPNTNRSGTSPPEAAVEATPETTPVKVRQCYKQIHSDDLKITIPYNVGCS